MSISATVCYCSNRGSVPPQNPCRPLSDLHAEQKEFPNCIEDGILILHEDCRPGDDMAKLLGRDDHVVEYEITPNRPDCLCMIGLAREVAVTFGKELKLHEPVVKAKAGGSIADMAKIVIEDPTLCPRYTARLVKNVRNVPVNKNGPKRQVSLFARF